MKKFYFSVVALLLCVVNTSTAQYTATNSGNWSNPITWAPGAPPSTVCNNCMITINSGVTVQLDAHVELQGSSLLVIGTSSSSPSDIVIGNSSNTTIQSGYNIVLDTLPGNSVVIFKYANSIIDGTSAGRYDGIFVGPLPNSIYQKVIGNTPSLFLGNAVIGTSAPRYQTLSGPVTLFSGGTLPITLINFKAALYNGAVNVSWTTEQEINADLFYVQRSPDGSAWENVGVVAAHGSSSIPIDYSFTDPTPLSGVNYYRLKSVDKNGRYIFSVVVVVRGSLINGVKVFPNPAKNYVNISLGNDVTANQLIRLTDLYGKVLQQKQVTNAGGSTITFPVNNYAQGIYLLQVKSASGAQQTYKVFVSQN